MSFEEFLMASQFIENVEAKIGDKIEEKKRKKEAEEGVGAAAAAEWEVVDVKLSWRVKLRRLK